MDKNNLIHWFEKQEKLLAIEVKEIPIFQAKDWEIKKVNGHDDYIAHKTGKFHRGVFLLAEDKGRPEAGLIERFLIAPIPPENDEILYGVVLMARYKDKYLIQAKSEPGNWGDKHVQITSTIHASYTNIQRKLSGAIPFTEMYEDPTCISFIIAQDGAQLYLKNNKICFLELREEPSKIPSNFTWATKEEICEFAKSKPGFISEHVMQCLGASVLGS